MATTDTDVDFTLESREDYAFGALLVVAGLVAIGIVVLAPLYVFASLGTALGVTQPLVFGLGAYVMAAIYLYGRVN